MLRFMWIPMLWVFYTFLILSVRGSTLDVRVWRLLLACMKLFWMQFINKTNENKIKTEHFMCYNEINASYFNKYITYPTMQTNTNHIITILFSATCIIQISYNLAKNTNLNILLISYQIRIFFSNNRKFNGNKLVMVARYRNFIDKVTMFFLWVWDP